MLSSRYLMSDERSLLTSYEDGNWRCLLTVGEGSGRVDVFVYGSAETVIALMEGYAALLFGVWE